MGFDVVAAYLVTAAGLAMVAVVGWMVWTRDVDPGLANGVLLKLLGQRRIDRAMKLCKAAPESYLFAIEAAIAIGTRGDHNVTVIESNVFATFDDKAAELDKLRKARIEAGLAGVLLAASGVALAAFDGPVPFWILAMGGLAVATGVMLLVRRSRLAKATERARTEVLPALVAAIVAGEAPAADDSDPYRVAGVPAPTLPPPPARVLEDAFDSLPAAKPRTSLRDGECPLCSHSTISRIDNASDPRFHKLVCAACGYTQEFADTAQLG